MKIYDNYRAVKVCDCQDYTVQYGIIMLHNKHTLEELQEDINRIKNEKQEELYKYGNDYEVILGSLSDKLDWFEVPVDALDCVEV